MQNIKHAVITCAGYGSRLGLNKPKCLVEIEGRTLLSYLLELLEGIEDIRVVVGFMEEQVIEEAKKINPEIVIVRNPDYRTTSNAYSLYLGTKDLKEPFLMIDGDMIIAKESFKEFLTKFNVDETIVGISAAKTQDAVFVSLNPNNEIISFQRDKKAEYEWCGIAYLKGIKISKNGQYVYNEIEPFLPQKSFVFNCFEIDTPEDMEIMVNNFNTLGY